MEPSLSTIVAVVGQLALVLAAGTAYLRRVRVERPPVGVFNLRDVAVVGLVLVIIPPLYLRLPALALAAVLAVLSTVMLSVTMAPVVGGRRAFTFATALVAGDAALAGLARESYGWLFDGVNNLALTIVVVGVCAMWVQSGVRARHVAVLAGCLAVYDVVATSALPLMADLVDRLSSLPLTPMLVWGEGKGLVGIGMGDLLLILLWTMVAEKAFSRRAGLVAAGMGLASVFALFLAFWLDVVNSPVPAMVPLGPLMVGHYLVLARKSGRERTTAEYLATLPRPSSEAKAAPAVEPIDTSRTSSNERSRSAARKYSRRSLTRTSASLRTKRRTRDEPRERTLTSQRTCSSTWHYWRRHYVPVSRRDAFSSLGSTRAVDE